MRPPSGLGRAGVCLLGEGKGGWGRAIGEWELRRCQCVDLGVDLDPCRRCQTGGESS
jgi:hypothetical protein